MHILSEVVLEGVIGVRVGVSVRERSTVVGSSCAWFFISLALMFFFACWFPVGTHVAVEVVGVVLVHSAGRTS